MNRLLREEEINLCVNAQREVDFSKAYWHSVAGDYYSTALVNMHTQIALEVFLTRMSDINHFSYFRHLTLGK